MIAPVATRNLKALICPLCLMRIGRRMSVRRFSDLTSLNAHMSQIHPHERLKFRLKLVSKRYKVMPTRTKKAVNTSMEM